MQCNKVLLIFQPIHGNCRALLSDHGSVSASQWCCLSFPFQIFVSIGIMIWAFTSVWSETLRMAAPHQVQAILKRGKREVAISAKSDCLQHKLGQLNILLNHFLDPSKSLDDFSNLEWCRCLIAGGMSFDEFSKTGDDGFRMKPVPVNCACYYKSLC